MIHNNLRKLVKKLMLVSRTSLEGFVDTTGYIQQDTDTATDDTTFTISKSSDSPWSNTTYASISNFDGSTYYKGMPFAVIGHSVEENEPDYSLGEILMPNTVKITTSITKTGDLIYATVLTNSGNADIEFDEVALFTHCWGGVWGGTTSKPNFMLIKNVLEEPSKLRAGESISLSFNLFGDVTISEG